MSPVTALILTYNEERNIARTLTALSPIERILLVDSDSSDNTVEIARRVRPDVHIVGRQFDSHTTQWNFGLDQVTTEWVLTLDADYEVSPELAAEIQALSPSAEVIAYSCDFVYRIYGHALRASSYPPRLVLFRVQQARYVDVGHTQTLWIKTPTGELRPPSEFQHGLEQSPSPTRRATRIEKLGGKIFHDDRKPLSHWIRAQDRYATLEAPHLVSLPADRLNRQDRLRRKIFFAAPAIFIYLLFWRGLILDGWSGWFYVAQRTIAELLLSIRLLIELEGLEAGSDWKQGARSEEQGATGDDKKQAWSKTEAR
jgi:glycosyltransferase involved in cell wall biosynthesis